MVLSFKQVVTKLDLIKIKTDSGSASKNLNKLVYEYIISYNHVRDRGGSNRLFPSQA